MCGSPLLKHLLHPTLEIVSTHTHTHTHTHTLRGAHAHAKRSQTGDLRELKEPPATECSRPVPLFYCKFHLKGRQLKGSVAAVDTELIKAALVSTWVALARKTTEEIKTGAEVEGQKINGLTP